MSKKKYRVYLPIAFVFLIIGVFVYRRVLPYVAHEREADAVLAKCKSLEIGMTFEEFESIMGIPEYTNAISDDGIEYYYFKTRALASEPTGVSIKENKVYGITCGSDYSKILNET